MNRAWLPRVLASLTLVSVGCTAPADPQDSSTGSGGLGPATPLEAGASGAGAAGGTGLAGAGTAGSPAAIGGIGSGGVPNNGGIAGSAGATVGGSGAGGSGGSPSSGTVYFENDGRLAGWSTAKIQGGTIGRLIEVAEPVYRTSTALLSEQTYKEPRGAHSEVTLATVQANDEDRYYGQVIYLPSDWNTIDKNATFQQFSPENPAGPWTLNWIQNETIWIRVAGHHYDCGPIEKGKWTRIVVRFKTSNPGIFEYWVDGEKRWSVTDVDLTIPNGSPTIRWSVGIYVTWWRDQEPGPQLTRQIYHDQMRVASSYELADPANW